MMVPDFTLIAEIMMFSEGFQNAKPLSKKMIAIMELSQQQLSKQDHYDYGLRSFVIPIARAAGAMKRTDPDASEEVILYRTMKDLILPKLVYVDLPLFQALLTDLFPTVEINIESGEVLRKQLELECQEANLQVLRKKRAIDASTSRSSSELLLMMMTIIYMCVFFFGMDDIHCSVLFYFEIDSQPVPAWITKIIQVYHCMVARHGNMIVGKTGSGKSEAWKMLKSAMGNLKKNGVVAESGEFEKVGEDFASFVCLSRLYTSIHSYGFSFALLFSLSLSLGRPAAVECS